VYYQLVKKQLK